MCINSYYVHINNFCIYIQTQTYEHAPSLATVTFSVVEFWRSAIPTSGMLRAAMQVYWPPSDVLSGENV